MKNENEKYIFSKVLTSGVMLETVYSPDTGKTSLIVTDDGEPKTKDSYTDEDGLIYHPFPGKSDLLSKRFIKLPSELGQYDDLASAYRRVRDFIAEFVNLPPDFLTIASVYVLLTWVHDRYQTLPYLRTIGDYGTGKSRLLQVVGNLCYKSIMATGSTSTPAIFRTLDLVQGTLTLDEADFRASDLSAEITKILNSGHMKDAPVTRMKVGKPGDDMKTEAFIVYGPKILASRDRFKDEALESRCLTQLLLPIKKTGRSIHLPNDFEKRALELRNMLLAFRLDAYWKTATDENSLRGIEFPRLKQSALALTSLSASIGDDVLQEVLQYLERYERELLVTKKLDVGADVLLCVLNLAMEKRSKDKDTWHIYMEDIKNKFMESGSEFYSDSDVSSYHRDDGSVLMYPKNVISAKKVGGVVRKLGIRVDRDGHGFFIPLPQEVQTLELLAHRYGFEVPWAKGWDSPTPESLDDLMDSIKF